MMDLTSNYHIYLISALSGMCSSEDTLGYFFYQFFKKHPNHEIERAEKPLGTTNIKKQRK
jgi:hypothetical protein